ncbi:MAG: DUF5667 domain-containing protein [bacterium]
MVEEKKMLEQLNSLKEISPSVKWKEDNRGLLMNQIYQSQTPVEAKSFNWTLLYFKELSAKTFKFVSSPASIVCLLFLAVFGGGIASMKASENTKPGDSLYIAKIISEEAQRAFAFNDKDKAQLGIKFAGNRVKEIGQVMQDPDNHKEEKVSKLIKDFNNEMENVKSRLSRMDNVVAPKLVQSELGSSTEVAEDLSVFSANLGKDDKGLQISEQAQEENILSVVSENNFLISTSTDATSTPAVSSDPQSILKQAENLLDEENYEATLNMLQNVNEIVNNLAVGANSETASSSPSEAGGETEQASSTEE